MPFKNKEDKLAYYRNYVNKRYKEDPNFKKAIQDRNRKNDAKYKMAKDEIIKDFRKNGCKFCPEKESCCLVAHHVIPEEKDFSIAKACATGYSANRIKKELEKCVCVCSNCHSKIHAGLIVL